MYSKYNDEIYGQARKNINKMITNFNGNLEKVKYANRVNCMNNYL